MYYPNRPNIVDIEASGFGDESYPIEVGVVLSNGSRFCTLIQPADPWDHWDERAECIHKITRATLQTSGKPIHEVALMLNELLGETTIYTDGWVVDKTWMTTLFSAAGVTQTFSVSPLELILSEQQMAIWHETKNTVIDQARIERHRASNDAWIIQETYWLTQKIADAS